MQKVNLQKRIGKNDLLYFVPSKILNHKMLSYRGIRRIGVLL